jgi:N-sulfoglucosamine sulfohydrolase
MDRRRFMRAMAAGAAGLVAPRLLAGGEAGRGAKPNLVVFFSDDHGWRDSTPYGATDVRTPNMKRLAAAGVTFTHAFIASPACAPSRAAMLTGLMPARNGAEANHTYPRKDIKALPAYLHELGYEVAAFGKVAHGRSAARYGFDRHDPKYHTAVVAEYLSRRDKSRPLCLLVGTHQPHVPWPDEHDYDPRKLKLPPTHVDTPETREFRARYYQDVTIADTELGEIHDLARKRLGDNTLFIYTSDHGAQWPFGKWNLYDAGTRCPFIAAWPGVIKPGSASAAMVSWIDLLPTFVELAGGTPPTDIDGRSFAAVLRGKTDTHRDRIFTTHSGDGRMNVYPIRSVRSRRWKYILNLRPDLAHTTHIDQARGKDGLAYWLPWRKRGETDALAAAVVKRYHQRSREELYDLDADPYEQHNLASDAKHAERLAALRAEMKAWMARQGDKSTVFNRPRPLSEPDTWAPAADVADAPAAAASAVVATAVVWRFTTTRPGDGWTGSGFDDTGWKRGPGGFGRIRQPMARVRTPWRTSDIWLRRPFTLKRMPKRPVLLIFHDEDAEVYLNGKRIARLKGHVTGYVAVPLDAAARSALTAGENLLAVHCRQSSGGQYIDAHIVDGDR